MINITFMRLKKNNILSIILIASSLLLLLAFQLFWLHRLYEEQKEWLAAKADHLFHKSIFEAQDDLLLQWIQGVKKETYAFESQASDSIQIRIEDPVHRVRTGIRHGKIISGMDTASLKEVKFIAAVARDSVELNRQITVSIPDVTSFQHFSMLDLTGDSLNVEKLEKQFLMHMDTAGVDLLCQIRQFNTIEEAKVQAGLKTNAIFAGGQSGGYYLAIFPQYRWFLLHRMWPQIVFSFFLFWITTLAFWIVYRNLQRQKRLIAVKNDFISNITHELKTPITTVGVAIEALSNFNALQNPQRTEEYLDISKNELKRLSLLVDKVLRMSLFEHETPELKLEHFDLRELIEEILRTMQLQFDKFAAKVNFQWSGQNFRLEADRLHLTSVIYNLIDNALKYSRQNPEIQIGLEKRDSELALSVRDNGLGIPLEYQRRIFDKFFRVPDGDRHDAKGHGLGLSYVASVIKKHDGEIKVDSKPGEGSEFKVRIPINSQLLPK